MRVYRYQLAVEDAEQTVMMPSGALVDSAHWRPFDRTLNVWARVPDEPDVPLEPHKFRVVGTGWTGRIAERDRHIATVLVDGGSLVFHVYEVLG